jgi:hypothetical protein
MSLTRAVFVLPNTYRRRGLYLEGMRESLQQLLPAAYTRARGSYCGRARSDSVFKCSIKDDMRSWRRSFGTGVLLESAHFEHTHEPQTDLLTDGFDFHFTLLRAVQLVNAVPDDPDEDELGPGILPSIMTAVTSVKSEGKRLRALIVTNPHNLSGKCYSPTVLTGLARFCAKHEIHLIVDEIYALSRYHTTCPRGEQDFVSILSLNLESLGVYRARVHTLWGTSKDFSSSSG